MRVALLAVLFTIVSVAHAQVDTEIFRRLMTEDGTAVAVDAAAAFATGNTDYLRIGLGGRADVRLGIHYAFLVGSFDFSTTDERTFVDQSFAHLRHNRTLAPRLLAESFVQIQRNRQERLDRRTLLGAGLRYEFVQRDSLGVAVGGTPMFEYEVLDEALGGTQDAVLRVSTYLSGRLRLASGASVTAVTYVQPRVSAPSDLRVLSSAGLEIGLSRFVTFRVRANVRYDSRPPDDVETLDVALENGLVIVIPSG